MRADDNGSSPWQTVGYEGAGNGGNVLPVVYAEKLSPRRGPWGNGEWNRVDCVKGQGIHCDMKVTDNPIRGIEWCVEMIKNPVEVPLK